MSEPTWSAELPDPTKSEVLRFPTSVANSVAVELRKVGVKVGGGSGHALGNQPVRHHPDYSDDDLEWLIANPRK